jgi:DNA-binding FadR family transcriptional regulator
MSDFHIPYGTEINKKILFYILENKKSSPTELSKKFGVGLSTVRAAILKMEKQNVLFSKKRKGVRYFCFNKECYWVEDFMRLLQRIQRSKYFEKGFSK